MIKKLLTIALFSALLLAQGCAQTKKYSGTTELKTQTNASSKILLMPLDVELSELSALGFLETKADWTENAKEHMTGAISEYMTGKQTDTIVYQPTSTDPEATNYQLSKLHEAVGYSVLVHHLGHQQLPTKKQKFDWSLGTDAQTLAKESGADYALFVFVRDSYASAGRVAMQVLLGAHGGIQVGFASLVDLKTGDIVWFNRLVSTSGDLRTEKAAKKTIGNLLDSFPAASK
ncbi:hypothetical protein [Pseudoalteromonas rubra]|uniref:Lipoprotein n=1 Tax=Pseudoalteromonas rubra TaxID=43658 RepID=A0A5S3WW49_9GAMM|nr:hypothetical protein [Pseudoalteromonas rubra]TMP34125.1 hypothetical protein CWB98_18640 [Pseudoalteromonas rubra]